MKLTMQRTLVTLFAVLLTTGTTGLHADEQPHIVLLVADDLGYGDLGCYGASDIESPVLDRLAREGVRFTSFYANAPECTPTRTALLTGRYQQRVGGMECAIGVRNVGRYDEAIRLAEQGQLGLPVEEVSIAQRLKDAGYTCGMFGKWHLGYEEHFRPLRQGFDKSFGCLGGNVDYFRHTEWDGWNTLFEDDELIERDGYMTDVITDAALDWYHSVKSGDKPFFLYVPYTAPHWPIQGPDDDTGQPLPREEWTDGPRETYAEMVKTMDSNIGRILDAIEEDGLRRETLVIFFSDNGADHNGRNAPWSGLKSHLFEGGIRTPCIVRWPGRLPEGRVVNHVAISMDLTRSIARAGGAIGDESELGSTLANSYDGIDILREIEEDEPATDRTLFWRFRRGDRTTKAIRDGHLKRIWDRDGDDLKEWMFDLSSDPDEKINILTKRPDEADRLDQLMQDWERDVQPRR